MEILEEKKESGWTTVLLIIMNIILWTIIALILFFFNGVVHALTPVEANFNYDSNGTPISYNIKPDGGTTGFIYNNEFFGQEINQSSYRYYKLPGSTFTTTNINGYFQNPCQSNQEMSYTMTINFYKQSTSTNTMSGVSVINGINGCSGYLSQLPDSVVYYNVCTIQPGDVPKFSLYFSESSSGMTTYRVGIPTNFSYTCQVGNQALIDNATANANNIINNIQQTTDNIIEQTTQAINSANEYCTNYEYTNTQNIEQDSAILRNTGEIQTGQGTSSFAVSKYTKVKQGEYLIITSGQSNSPSYCLYDNDKNLLNCSTYNMQTNITIVPQQEGYIRYTIQKNNSNFRFKGSYCVSNTQAIIDANGNYFSELNGAIQQGLDAEHIHVDPDTEDFEDLEDVETSLHTYTNVNLDSFDVDLDTDTNSWVWNTITSLLNTSTLVFGMVISILSIGLIKLILNR